MQSVFFDVISKLVKGLGNIDIYLAQNYHIIVGLTCIIFMATSLNPFCSKRLMISPTSPLWTASGFNIMKVRSRFPAIFEVLSRVFGFDSWLVSQGKVWLAAKAIDKTKVRLKSNVRVTASLLEKRNFQ